MNITIYGQEHAEYRKCLVELLSRSPTPRQVDFQNASEKVAQKLSAWNGRSDLVNILAALVNDNSEANRFLLCVPREPKYKNYCLRQAGISEWGCCLSEFVAIEYARPDKALETQLHETLHLFGVDECYDSSRLPKSTCEHPQCLMRYDASSIEVCSSVLRQLSAN
jgi:hypothetical protein